MRGHASQALNGTFYDIGLSMFLYIVARFQSYGWTEGKNSFFSMSPPPKQKKNLGYQVPESMHRALP